MNRQEELQRVVLPLIGAPREHDMLLRLVGKARFVLLGVSADGVRELQRARIELTKLLIDKCGFSLVCIEGDWPDVRPANAYVLGQGAEEGVLRSVAGFRRFPGWMWRTDDVLDFLRWLRERNRTVRERGSAMTELCGLDLYSLRASIEAVVRYLQSVDDAAAARAVARYRALEPFAYDVEAQGTQPGMSIPQTSQRDVLSELMDLQQHAEHYINTAEADAADRYFDAEQNARVVVNAERYYRARFENATHAWNVRQMHMQYTLERMLQHAEASKPNVRVVVWANNISAGNAHATSMLSEHRTSLGALVRRRHARDAVLIGLTTYKGAIAAASSWCGTVEKTKLRPARADSYEYIFHDLELPCFFLQLRGTGEARIPGLPEHARERTIGAVYHREAELECHYHFARIAEQFDAVYHFDVGRALMPIRFTGTNPGGGQVEQYGLG